MSQSVFLFPLCAGKSTVAIALARHYNAAMLTLDGVIMDAIASGNTSAGMRARQLCAEAAHRKAEEVRLQESEESEKKPAGLSVEAVTVHTQGGGGYLFAFFVSS